jgi:hypothetical protein
MHFKQDIPIQLTLEKGKQSVTLNFASCVMEVETAPPVTRLICVMAVELAFPIWSLKVPHVNLAPSWDHAKPSSALLMEAVLKTFTPRMDHLVVLTATSVLLLMFALLVFVPREHSWNQEPVVEVVTAPLVTRLIFVMEVELVYPTGNLRALHATLALKWQNVWSTSALRMENALKTLMPRMELLVDLKVTNALWLIHALLVFVSREISLNQEQPVEVQRAPLVTRQTHVMAVEHALPTWNLKASHVNLALKWDLAWHTSALWMEPVFKTLMPRMALLVDQKATSVPWLTLALLVFVSRELSWKLA